MSPKKAPKPATRQTWHDKHVEMFIDILRNPAHRPVGGKRNARMIKATVTWEPILAKMNELTPAVNEAILKTGYKETTKTLPVSWTLGSLKKKFQALGGTYKALKAQRGLNSKDKPGTGSSSEEKKAFDQRLVDVSAEFDWFAAFHEIFSDCARYDTGMGECTLAVIDEDNDGNYELPLMADDDHMAYSTSLEMADAPQGEPDDNDVAMVVSSGDKIKKKVMQKKEAKGRANEVAEDTEVLPFKLSGKSLAVAQSNATIKLNMLTELAAIKSSDRVDIQEAKAKLKRELFEKELASREVARMQVINARVERDSKKRTADMRDHYMKVGMSPISATNKAKIAEQLLNDN